MNQRFADQERRVSAIEATLARLSEQLDPVLELYEQAKTSGLIQEGGVTLDGSVGLMGDADVATTLDSPFGHGFARSLADTLGLDPELKVALQATVAGIFEKIKVLEKQNASVSTEGDTTTLTIGTYDSSGLQRDWDDWVSRNLTPDERAKMEREHATNRIFGSRLGGHQRTIKIKEADGMIDIKASAARDGAEALQTREIGPVLARDLMLEPYAHLLD